jgi:hypothetical protein
VLCFPWGRTWILTQNLVLQRVDSSYLIRNYLRDEPFHAFLRLSFVERRAEVLKYVVVTTSFSVFCDSRFMNVHYLQLSHKTCGTGKQLLILNSLTHKSEPCSSVSIVSGCGLDYRAIEVRSPAEAKDFSSNLCVQTGSGAHPASCTMGTGDPFPGGKARPGRDADHSSPSSAEVDNE